MMMNNVDYVYGTFGAIKLVESGYGEIYTMAQVLDNEVITILSYERETGMYRVLDAKGELIDVIESEDAYTEYENLCKEFSTDSTVHDVAPLKSNVGEAVMKIFANLDEHTMYFDEYPKQWYVSADDEKLAHDGLAGLIVTMKEEYDDVRYDIITWEKFKSLIHDIFVITDEIERLHIYSNEMHKL